jgi:Protein of unknown function (DUF2971)
MKSDDFEQEEADWNESWSRPTRVVPPIVYYYCSVDAFIKIVTNKSLRLTNLFFLNDSQEFVWLRNKAHCFVKTQAQKHPDEFGYQYLETLLEQEWQREIYCACFSEQPDLLSQWRAYGEDGKGFAIGFSTRHLQVLCKSFQGAFANVIYDDEQQNVLVEEAFDLPPNLCDGEDPTIEEGSGTILRRISEAASRCKSKTFSEEIEWRLVCELHSASGTQFMERRGVITPYIEIPLVEGDSYRKRGNEPIKEIYFGPKNTAREQEYAVALMLANAGFKRVKVLRSTVTYR